MNDLEYLDAAEQLLLAVEQCCDRINDETDADLGKSGCQDGAAATAEHEPVGTDEFREQALAEGHVFLRELPRRDNLPNTVGPSEILFRARAGRRQERRHHRDGWQSSR